MDGNPVMITGTRNVSLSDFRQRFHATADEAGNFEERTPELRSLYTYDAQGNLVEASENGTDYHYTHDTEGLLQALPELLSYDILMITLEI